MTVDNKPLTKKDFFGGLADFFLKRFLLLIAPYLEERFDKVEDRLDKVEFQLNSMDRNLI